MDNKKFHSLILVRPQMGENIGACARAMKNFNFFNELRIVSPRDGWPNEKAIRNSAGGFDIIESAKIFDNLNDAISDLEYLYASTARKRDMNINSVEVRNLKKDYNLNLKSGVMFGPENSGLSNDEIHLANKIIYIDANQDFPSINLSQAVMLVCYELFKESDAIDFDNIQDLASKSEIGLLLDHLFIALEKNNFFQEENKKPIMKRNIANIFNRIDKFSKSEVQTFRGIIASCFNEKK
jgi:tRNA/rRNA methyltransferase